MPHNARALARAARARARERGEPYTVARQALLAIRQRMEEPGGTGLNPAYTFGTFVIGLGNRFAHAAAVAVAEAPGKAHNPLVIYGRPSLDRRHLLYAIGHYAQALYPGLKVRCTSSEAFTADFTDAARDGTLDGFRRRYRDPDILLVDDIQFLGNEEAAQEEFFRPFRIMGSAGRQVVITSDRAPRRLASLDGRLRAQLEWGLLVDVQPWPAARS